MKFHMSWRLASRLSVITLAILVVIVVTVIQQQRAAEQALQGTVLNGRAAADFKLKDQYGREVSLSQFKGKPVVVTFLFTNCPDVCPVTAEYLHQSLEALGDDAKQVAILAISTDPQRDDQAAALRFSQQHRMEDKWHYLVGTEKELAPVWTNYSVMVQNDNDEVLHTAALFILDKEGKQRVFLGDTFTPDQVTHDLRALLRE